MEDPAQDTAPPLPARQLLRSPVQGLQKLAKFGQHPPDFRLVGVQRRHRHHRLSGVRALAAHPCNNSGRLVIASRRTLGSASRANRLHQL